MLYVQTGSVAKVKGVSVTCVDAFPTFYWTTSVADWRYSGGFRQIMTSPDPGMPLGRGGITDPCSTNCIFTSVSSVLQAIARCPSGMYGKLHKHYVRHVSLGTGCLQSVGSLLACADPILVLHTLCCENYSGLL